MNIIDTAGIRSTEDVVEKIGVERAKEYAGKADLIIYVVDASVPLDDSDKEIFYVIQDKKVIILLNKSDLDMVVSEEELIKVFNDNSGLDSNDSSYKEDITDIENTLSKEQNAMNNSSLKKISKLQIIKTSTKENTGIDVFAVNEKITSR